MDDPHAEVETKPQLKPRGSVAKEEDPKPSHHLYKLQIKSTRLTRQTLALWNILKDIESSHKRSWTLKARTHRSRTKLESELPSWKVQRSAQCWRAS